MANSPPDVAVRSPPTSSVGLWLVLVLAVGLRGGAWWAWSAELTVDRDAYLGIAEGLVAGRGFCSPGSSQPTAYRPPLFPLLVAAVWKGSSPAAAVIVVNGLTGLLTVAATWQLAVRWGWSTWSATFAAALVAADPLLLRYTPQPMTECVFTALTIASLVLLQRAADRSDVSAWWLPGVALGLAALCRPTIWPFVPVAVAFAALPASPPRRHRWACAACLLAGVALTVSPWVIRNQLVFGEPILTTTHGGYTLHLGNNAEFYADVARQPWGRRFEGEPFERWQQRTAARLPAHGTERAIDRAHSQLARDAIQQDPAGFGWAVWYRLRSLWSLAPRTAAAGGWTAGIVAAWSAVLFAAAFTGLWQGRRIVPRAALLTLGLVLAVQAVHLLYWTDARMRSPLVPVLAIWAAAAVLQDPRLRGAAPSR